MVLADVRDTVESFVVPTISDHLGVLSRLHFPTSGERTIERDVWNFSSADWTALIHDISRIDFSFIESENVNDE